MDKKRLDRLSEEARGLVLNPERLRVMIVVMIIAFALLAMLAAGLSGGNSKVELTAIPSPTMTVTPTGCNEGDGEVTLPHLWKLVIIPLEGNPVIIINVSGADDKLRPTTLLGTNYSRHECRNDTYGGTHYVHQGVVAPIP